MTLKKTLLSIIFMIVFSNAYSMHQRKITRPEKKVSFAKDSKPAHKSYTNGYNEPCNCLTTCAGCCGLGLMILAGYASKHAITTELSNYFNSTQS